MVGRVGGGQWESGGEQVGFMGDLARGGGGAGIRLLGQILTPNPGGSATIQAAQICTANVSSADLGHCCVT